MSAGGGYRVGQNYLESLEEYFENGGVVPLLERDGTLNTAELVRITGIPRSSFYQNEGIVRLIATRCEALGIQRQGGRVSRVPVPGEAGVGEQANAPNDSKLAKKLERRLHKLEQHNAALLAENHELRRQVKGLTLQLGREDMQIDSGRRIPSPPVNE